MRAHQHFNDPEWDGEPLEPEPGAVTTGDSAIVVTAGEPEPPTPAPRAAKIKVRLADGKERTLQHMSATTFWSADGRPMSAAQFLESLFGALPDFFEDEDELRRIWSDPDTRKSLLAGLADKGFGREPLAEMQKAIDAADSDLFDVRVYVASATAPRTREARASAARVATAGQLTDKQRAFVDFVLGHYVRQGVDELDTDQLAPLLKLKYRNALADAFTELGQPGQVRGMFISFQKHLYAAARQ